MTPPSLVCGTHGAVRRAYVCGHLFATPKDGSAPLVYYRADDEAPDEDADSVGDFWCEACDAMLQRDGGWNDASEAAADIRMVCEFCLAAILARNIAGED